MSGDARDFNNIETQAVIKFFFLQGKAPKEMHANLIETLGEHASSYATIKNWVAQFKCGNFSTCDVTRPGRPKTVTTPEIIDQNHELTLEDCQILAKSIAEQLGISHEQVGSIIHEDLDMAEALREEGPEMPERGSKMSTVPFVWATFGIFSLGAIQMNSCWVRLVTLEETWLYHNDLEAKQQSMEWQYSSSPCPKNSECKNPPEKFSPQFFGMKTASSSLIIFQTAKLSTQSITHLFWCN